MPESGLDVRQDGVVEARNLPEAQSCLSRKQGKAQARWPPPVHIQICAHAHWGRSGDPPVSSGHTPESSPMVQLWMDLLPPSNAR